MSKKGRVQKKNLNRVNNRDVVVMGTATDELKNLSIILISIIGVICIFYIITVFITKNNSGLKYQTSEQLSQISYTDILASDILNRNGTYYVLVKDDEDTNLDLYNSILSSYASKADGVLVYSVDLNDALNQQYKGTDNNFSSSELKFKETCLLKVVDGKIESSYGDKNSIIDHLKTLVESN